jgi:DNA-binding NtrC family response regulator
MQAKFLRLLQDRVFARVGGEAPLRSAARIIAATNANLSERVRCGEFREDLFFRLNVIAIDIPALAERREDILPLALRFIGEFAGRFDREVLGFTGVAQESLFLHDFPGNIRELRNRIERAVALSEGPWIGVSDLFPERVSSPRESDAPLTLAAAREDAERRLISRALAETNDDVDRAAIRLEVSRSTLFEKIRRLGIRH